MDMDTLPCSGDPDEVPWGRSFDPEDLTHSFGSPEHAHDTKPPAAVDDVAGGCGSDPGNSAETGAHCRLAASDIGELSNVEEEEGAAVTCPRQKLQEKNRKAQQRFRARQKAKLAEKDSQIQDLVQQLSELLDASNSLKSQNGQLARMLKLSPQCCIEQRPLEMRQQQTLQAEVSAGMTTSLVQRAPTGARSPPAGTIWQEDKQAEGLTLTVKGAKPIQLTADQVNMLTPDTLKILWKGYVNQLALSLLELDGANRAAAQERAAQLSQEACALLLRFAAANPHGFKTLSASHLEDPRKGVEDRDIWLVVMRAMALSSQQKSELMQLRQAYLSSLKLVLQQRAAWVQALSTASPCIHSAIHTSHQYLQMHHLTDSIKAGLDQENGVLLSFVSGCFSSVLEPVQTARMLVQSYPWLPDIVSVSSWVAYELGDAEAVQELRSPEAPAWPQLPSPPSPHLFVDSAVNTAGQLPQLPDSFA